MARSMRLQNYLDKAEQWTKSVEERLKYFGGKNPLSVIRAVLHALRDNMTATDAVFLSAQLPILIRGLYFEGWVPSEVPNKKRGILTFTQSVKDKLEQYLKADFTDADAVDAMQAVFSTMIDHIDRGEVDKLEAILPRGAREILSEVKQCEESTQ